MMASMDSVPSVVGPSGSSNHSQNVGVEEMGLSGQSSSGSSFLPTTDYMSGGPQVHMPGPGPVAMAMIAQHSVTASDAYSGVSVPVAAYPVPSQLPRQSPEVVHNLSPESSAPGIFRG
ncbi:hypothetical protein PI124_g17478 [Phytophthora idaei]|nr:hypothetical protein PI125_g18054 [Phytophthora idaei]KAG3138809.1 hypothetical protein PI126_g16747 [Phytophthora idaei]KAG3237535.1 hypothetical protein PI124_g17478 [Phytophthora idaei]